MPRRLPTALTIAAVLAAALGCGSQDRPSTGNDPGSEAGAPDRRGTAPSAAPAPEARLSPVPRAAVRRCAGLIPRRSIPVLCPTRLPKGDWIVRYQTLATGRLQYLASFQTCPLGSGGSGGAHHVLAGGRRGRWPLETARGRWPADTEMPRDLILLPHGSLQPGEGPDDLQREPLRVLGRATVDEHPALLLRAAEYPAGGAHGGHLIAVWNQAGNGYTLSMHFGENDSRSQEEREAVLLQAAAAMSRFSSGERADAAQPLERSQRCPARNG